MSVSLGLMHPEAVREYAAFRQNVPVMAGMPILSKLGDEEPYLVHLCMGMLLRHIITGEVYSISSVNRAAKTMVVCKVRPIVRPIVGGNETVPIDGFWIVTDGEEEGSVQT